MKITFECECGADVSKLTRGGGERELQYECPDCGTIYAVTITPLSGPHA